MKRWAGTLTKRDSLILREVLAILGHTGRSSARLERLVRDQEAGGSNPPAPTSFTTPEECARQLLPSSSRALQSTVSADQLETT